MLAFGKTCARYMKYILQLSNTHLQSHSLNSLHRHQQSLTVRILRSRLVPHAQMEIQIGHIWVCKTLQPSNIVQRCIHNFLLGLFYFTPCRKTASISLWYMLGATTRGWRNLNFIYFVSKDSSVFQSFV